ncbi:hypothetical protein EVAR_96415_1 [Eumeta japonica]|uniref:Uncharacterized protein n=1 Tax=Eumeta variegata TaxID=151549 RepID=A0A4C1WDZ1_EUMVA|nr:hypothetical protein EVAR_96415_1 [Eumeta japonica]
MTCPSRMYAAYAVDIYVAAHDQMRTMETVPNRLSNDGSELESAVSSQSGSRTRHEQCHEIPPDCCLKSKRSSVQRLTATARYDSDSEHDLDIQTRSMS